ncbi:MAG: hypothetical protein LBP37_02605 [Spirochaetaceae bacterium]|nr:hypothetical protein [Spirochaetaceae bacterium]
MVPSFLLLFYVKTPLNAQDGRPPPPRPRNNIAAHIRDRSIELHMVTRVLEKDNTEAWNSDTYKVTTPGHPVGLKIVGENVAVFVQFTPYPRNNGRGILVAQGRIFTGTPGGGVQCRTLLKTVPLQYGEQVFFFPLGPGRSDDEARIEIQIEMNRYSDIPVNEEAPDEADTPIPPQ